MGIVIIGAIFVDIKGYPANVFIPTGRNVGSVEIVHGGVCRNVAEDIANLELRPTLVSLADDSGTGEEVIKKLKKHKINTDYIRRTPDGLGTWLVIFDNSGDVYASISKRPDLSQIGDILDEKGDEIFADADSIVVEIDMDKEILKRVFSYAEKYGKTVYAIVSNMGIAVKRRDLLQRTGCIVCNQQEAGILFSEEYQDCTPEEMKRILAEKIRLARIRKMIVTMGEKGAVYAELDGNSGYCPANKVQVVDTAGAGDSFFAGVAVGLTYGKTLQESCEIGTRLAASVIATTENVCPRFLPDEFGLNLNDELRNTVGEIDS